MKIYMLVTQDEYGLPLDFDQSARGLARRLGLQQDAVLKYISKHKDKDGYPKFIRVEIDE